MTARDAVLFCSGFGCALVFCVVVLAVMSARFTARALKEGKR